MILIFTNEQPYTIFMDTRLQLPPHEKLLYSCCSSAVAGLGTAEIKPYGALPSAAQLKWQQLE